MPVAVGNLGIFIFGSRRVSVPIALRAGVFLIGILPGILGVGILLIAAIIVRAILGSRAQDPEIVLGMLVIIFRHDGVSRGHRFLGQRLILIDDLLRISANLEIRSVTVKMLSTRWAASPCPVSPASHPPVVRTWSHYMFPILFQIP